MKAREAVYWWLYSAVGGKEAVQFELWMAIRDSGISVSEIAKKLNLKARQVWAILDSETDPMFSSIVLVARAIGRRLSLNLSPEDAELSIVL